MIPPLLHQTWATTSLPDDLEAYRATWERLNPELLTWWLWDDNEAREFVAAYYPDFLPTYDSLPFQIMRADVVRYLWLYYWGGIYADLDMECTGSATSLLDGDIHLVEEQYAPGHWVVSNALMASKRKHPFWIHVLDCVKRQIPKKPRPGYSGKQAMVAYVLDTTGPYMLTQALASYPGRADIQLHRDFSMIAKHHHVFSWL